MTTQGSSPESGGQVLSEKPSGLIAMVAAARRQRSTITPGCLVPEHLLRQHLGDGDNGAPNKGDAVVLRLGAYQTA